MSLPQQSLPSHWSDAQRGRVKLCESMSPSMTHSHWPLPNNSKAGSRCLPSAAGTMAKVEGCAASRRTQKDNVAQLVSSVTFLKGMTVRLNDTHWPLAPRIVAISHSEKHNELDARCCFPQLAGTAPSKAYSELLPQKVRVDSHQPPAFLYLSGSSSLPILACRAESLTTHGSLVVFSSARLAVLASTMKAMLSLSLWGGFVDTDIIEVGASLAGALSMILRKQARRRSWRISRKRNDQGSLRGRAPNRHRDCALGLQCILRDYFVLDGAIPVHREKHSQRRFQVPRAVFMSVHQAVKDRLYWRKRVNATRKPQSHPLQ